MCGNHEVCTGKRYDYDTKIVKVFFYSVNGEFFPHVISFEMVKKRGKIPHIMRGVSRQSIKWLMD